MSQLHFPGLEPPSASCEVPHPLYRFRLCIYKPGHPGKHGCLVPGTTMIEEWNDEDVPNKLELIKSTTKTPPPSGKRARRHRR